MKKPTQAEEIISLKQRLCELEQAPKITLAKLWDEKGLEDETCMKFMVERFTPPAPEPSNSWAIIAMIVAFIALIYAVALNKRMSALETAKAPVEVAQTWTAPQQVVPTLEVAVAETCWMRITDADGKIIREGMFSSPWSEARDFVNVRNGCPGKVTYKVNGKEVHPINKSGKPEQSEVVTIP